jgi:hypothetical protein
MIGLSPQANSTAIFKDLATAFNIKPLKMENYFIIIDSSLNLFIVLKSECFATMNYCYLLGTF